jgi:hypothetical protein
MARGRRAPANKHSDDLAMLDELIRRSFKELLASIGENVKIGDFIKMLETRHKLTPAGDDQGEFWSMLEKIRKETLSDEKEEVSGRDDSRQRSKGRKNRA